MVVTYIYNKTYLLGTLSYHTLQYVSFKMQQALKQAYAEML